MSHTQTSRRAGDSSPVPPPRDSRRGEQYEALPWTGITLFLAVVGLLLFMALPMRKPRLQEMLAMQKHHFVQMAHEELARAIEEYHNDHGMWPGTEPVEVGMLGPRVHDQVWLARQLKMCTDSYGFVVPQFLTSHPWGPYLPSGIPINPETGLNTVRIVGEGESLRSANDGLFGWIYDPRSGAVEPDRLNLPTVQNAVAKQ